MIKTINNLKIEDENNNNEESYEEIEQLLKEE